MRIFYSAMQGSVKSLVQRNDITGTPGEGRITAEVPGEDFSSRPCDQVSVGGFYTQVPERQHWVGNGAFHHNEAVIKLPY
jgi:hypothetical protein